MSYLAIAFDKGGQESRRTLSGGKKNKARKTNRLNEHSLVYDYLAKTKSSNSR